MKVVFIMWAWCGISVTICIALSIDKGDIAAICGWICALVLIAHSARQDYLAIKKQRGQK